jgi:hypothetical protein
MIHTYGSLSAALINDTADKSSEFAAAIPLEIIPEAEIRVLRDLDLTIFDQIVSGALVSGTPLTTKPAGCLVTRDIFYTSVSGQRLPLVNRDYSLARDYWPDETVTTTTPKYFAEYSPTEWYIAGTPAAAYAFSARCCIRPQGLSASNRNTWLGTNVGDLLLYAALVASAEFLQQSEQLVIWAQEYSDRLAAAKNEFWALRRQSYMPIVAIPNKIKEEQ